MIVPDAHVLPSAQCPYGFFFVILRACIMRIQAPTSQRGTFTLVLSFRTRKKVGEKEREKEKENDKDGKEKEKRKEKKKRPFLVPLEGAGAGGGTDLTVNSVHICTVVKELCHHCGITPPCCPVQCCLTLHTTIAVPMSTLFGSIHDGSIPYGTSKG